jgi:hypothetical protein
MTSPEFLELYAWEVFHENKYVNTKGGGNEGKRIKEGVRKGGGITVCEMKFWA